MNNSGKFVWLLSGAAIGAGIALLYAPQSGEKTREYLGAQTREKFSDVSETIRIAIRKGHELYEDGVAMVDEAAESWEKQVAGRTRDLRQPRDIAS